MRKNDRMHLFDGDISGIPLPDVFNDPFDYTPHPLCRMAARQVCEYLASRQDLSEETGKGKMFGVLVVKRQVPEIIGFLAAFSGNLAGSNNHPYFVPPVYDLLTPDGYFKKEEKLISDINRKINDMESSSHAKDIRDCLEKALREKDETLATWKLRLKQAKSARDEKRKGGITPEEEQRLIEESRFLKAECKRTERKLKEHIGQLQQQLNDIASATDALKKERRQRSAALQQWLFSQFVMQNANGARKDLCEIFAQTGRHTPPAGAGECAAPKLLQYAFLHGLKPLAMAEFWLGESPAGEIRRQGQYYPACRSKCFPILGFMLQGLKVHVQPPEDKTIEETDIIYDDEWLAVINKPHGMLSVPGKDGGTSVYAQMKKRYPDATGPIMVHRLDMDTSGLMVIAKTKEVHKALQQQFETREVKKTYTAMLNGEIEENSGTISLPLSPDYEDRPRQKVDHTHGKRAVTAFRVLRKGDGKTVISLSPLTGRTHQLRVHSAHPDGLNAPIAGDRLYGTKGTRLCLHATSIEFTHPVSGQRLSFSKEPEF